MKKTKEINTKEESINLFDFLNSIHSGRSGINHLKDCFADNSESLSLNSIEKAYVPFMINRGLSYFVDTIMFANAMNEFASLPSKMQFDFYRNTIRPGKRFSKWTKKEDDSNDVKLIMAKYSYSSEKARDALRLFDSNALDELRRTSDRGGINKLK